MAEIQNYQINYTIDVKTNGIQDVTKFSEAINKLKISEKGAEAAITQVKNMVNKMDAIFKPKGRKRDVNYNVNVKTDLAEEKLDKVLRLIKDIQAEAAKINLVVNAGQKLDSQAIRAQAKAVLKADRFGRTGTYALSTSYTFGAVRCFCNINIHFAHLCTFTARNAFVLVYLHPKQRNLVEQCIECTEWTNPFAERSVIQHAQNDYRNQHNKFPRKQFSQCRTDTFVDCRKWQRTLKHTLRTYIFAKIWVAHPQIIYYEHR